MSQTWMHLYMVKAATQSVGPENVKPNGYVSGNRLVSWTLTKGSFDTRRRLMGRTHTNVTRISEIWERTFLIINEKKIVTFEYIGIKSKTGSPPASCLLNIHQN